MCRQLPGTVKIPDPSQPLRAGRRIPDVGGTRCSRAGPGASGALRARPGPHLGRSSRGRLHRWPLTLVDGEVAPVRKAHRAKHVGAVRSRDCEGRAVIARGRRILHRLAHRLGDVRTRAVFRLHPIRRPVNVCGLSSAPRLSESATSRRPDGAQLRGHVQLKRGALPARVHATATSIAGRGASRAFWQSAGTSPTGPFFTASENSARTTYPARSRLGFFDTSCSGTSAPGS